MAPLPPRLNGFVNLVGYLRNPYGSTLRQLGRLGDPLVVRAMGADIVVTGAPEHVRTILSADPDSYEAFGVELLAPVIGDDSLLLVSGDRHRAGRKLLAPPFHGARMRAYGALMQATTRAEMARWPREGSFVLQESTQALSLRVILRAVMGLDDGDETDRLQQQIVELIASISPAVLFLKWLQHDFGGIGPWARLQRRMRAVEALVLAEIAARRADATPRQDIVSLILSARYDDGSVMTDRQVYDMLMTLLVAGHETSAIAIAWAVWLLLGNPEVLARLRQELTTVGADDVDAIAALPYLDAVCNETLRIKPIAPSIVRLLRKPMTLAGYELPAGTCVSPSIIALHHREELYPEPHRFRPERFLERSFAPYEYMPFGGGNRRCIGAAFALYEMKLVLATMLTEPGLTLRLADPEAKVGEVPRNTVIGPRRPIRVVAARA